MPHPKVDNDSLIVVTPLFLDDEDGRPTVTVVLRACFEIMDRGVLALMESQPPLCAAGEFWGDPDVSSYKYEPEVAPLKLATDVAVIASAWAPSARTTSMDVGIQVGTLSKGLRVFGDRVWFSAGAAADMTKPLPFERIPISYDRAFGGWDRTAANPVEHDYERRNPSGRGFHGKHNRMREQELLPNIEDPAAPISGYRDRPAPAGIGFTSPHWLPRASLAGTYDAKWAEDRKPRLPKDFDARYFNAGSPGLVAPGFLRGDEPVHAIGMVPSGRLSFRLPAIPPPALRIGLLGEEDKTPEPKLDTVIVDLDMMRVTLLWRTRLRVKEGANDLRSIVVRSPVAAAFPRSHSAAAGVAANVR